MPKLLSRLLRPSKDEHAAVRPLWHRIVEVARAKPWYAVRGVPDTIGGRFDAITLVLCLVLLAMERGGERGGEQGGDDFASAPVLLTELFVTDMDGQLRESGVGDLVVGKHIGRLMSVLGGRLGAYREALTVGDAVALRAAVARNVSLNAGVTPDAVADAALALAQQLAGLPADSLLAGDFAR